MTAEDLAAEEKKFKEMGMNFRSLPTGHSAILTMPEGLMDILPGFADNQ